MINDHLHQCHHIQKKHGGFHRIFVHGDGQLYLTIFILVKSLNKIEMKGRGNIHVLFLVDCAKQSKPCNHSTTTSNYNTKHWFYHQIYFYRYHVFPRDDSSHPQGPIFHHTSHGSIIHLHYCHSQACYKHPYAKTNICIQFFYNCDDLDAHMKIFNIIATTNVVGSMLEHKTNLAPLTST